jgi:pyridinium-3,5-biscarboxylic acid mononucleotide sulfurtransferase
VDSSVLSDLDLQAQLSERLRALPGSVIAFSGGVDSSYLLWAAVAALGAPRVRAVLGVSPSVPKIQIEQAKRIAGLVGVPLATLDTTELEDERYRANLGDRCYFCKDTLFRAIAAIEAPAGWAILDGTNADDLGGHRPGRAAATEHRVLSPLAETGLSKAAIRRLSRVAGLPTADLPASPCLASRFPAGVEVTAEGLRRVEEAEAFLRTLGFVEFRVRSHGDHARIEVLARDFERLVVPATRAAVAARLRALGWRFVSLDLDGFESGRGSTMQTAST